MREMLLMGEWTSPAIFKYVDVDALDDDVVLRAHVDESDGEDTHDTA